MKILKINETLYPKSLKEIGNPPKLLYCNGNTEILNDDAITIIGSRNMTEYGKNITKYFVEKLTNAGLCIVSGMAVGIDAVAHRTCLENGGKTIAVLGSGFNYVFPQENIGLYHDIINNNGCVITEYSPETKASSSNFPKRNRIVSGLSIATVVIEATYRSGTKITANYALTQGKRLFCIPNCIGNKNSAGTIGLLKSGAEMVTSPEEILEKLNIKRKAEETVISEYKKQSQFIKEVEQKELTDVDEMCKKIYFFIKENKMVNLENMANIFKIDIGKINVYLSILELKGLIVNSVGLQYRVSDKVDI